MNTPTIALLLRDVRRRSFADAHERLLGTRTWNVRRGEVPHVQQGSFARSVRATFSGKWEADVDVRIEVTGTNRIPSVTGSPHANLICLGRNRTNMTWTTVIDFAANLFATTIGVLFAFYLTGRSERRNEERSRAKSRSELLAVLRTGLQEN